MAHMSQETKAKIAAELKKVMPKGWKYTLGVNHHSTIVLNIMKAPVDLIKIINESNAEHAQMRGEAPYEVKDSVQMNTHYLSKPFKNYPELEKLFKQIQDTLYGADYFDHSDSMVDYFHCAYYVDVNIGKWNKPFEYVKA